MASPKEKGRKGEVIRNLFDTRVEIGPIKRPPSWSQSRPFSRHFQTPENVGLWPFLFRRIKARYRRKVEGKRSGRIFSPAWLAHHVVREKPTRRRRSLGAAGRRLLPSSLGYYRGGDYLSIASATSSRRRRNFDDALSLRHPDRLQAQHAPTDDDGCPPTPPPPLRRFQRPSVSVG